MKYIKLFETHSLYEAYIADTVNFVRPNVSYCEDYSHVHYNNLLEISSALITCDSAIYNGETQIATNIVVMLGSVVLTNNTDYIVINNNGGINAGSYTFTIRGIGNYKGYKNGTFIINKMTPTVVAPTAKVLTYNGSAQELINAGSTNAGTLQYKVDDGSWSTNIPTGTNGGSYNVLYKVVGNNNVNDVEALSILCSINEKEVTATVELSLDTYTYSGNAYEPTVTVKDGGTIIPSSEYTVTYSNNINAGTATVTIIDNTGGNYAVIGSTTFTIEKATGSVTTIPVNKAVTYNESAQLVADAGAGTGTMMYRLGDSGDFSSSMPTATNAGTYTLYFYAAESANYLQSATQNIEVTISKAIPSYTSPQGKDNLIYSGESQELLIEGSSPDGIIKYSSDGGETWTTDIPEGINVVTYHLQWKVFGDSNHTDSTPINIDVSIAKVTPTVTAPTIVSNLEYTGAAQNLLNNDGSTNFGTLQYSSDNENFSTTIPTGTNAGSYDIWYRVQGDSNVNDVPSVKLTNSIAKVDACYVAPTAATGLVYDESSQALLNAGSSTCGIVLYSSDETNWSTNIPEGTNAGDYTSYWRVVADSNHIDKPSASITTNIDKAAGEIYTAPTPITGLIYNNTALSLITSGSGTGTMQYKVDSGSWESSIPTMINAGTYTIYYKVLESSNYYATDGTDYITTTIAKVTPTVTAPTPRVLTYNTSSLALVNAGSTDWGTLQYSLDDSTWSTNIPEAINYGSYTVHYRVVGNSNINDVPSDSVSCSIAEKRVSTPTIELDPTGYTYSGNQCKPSVIVKDGSHVIPSSEYTVTYSNNVNAGTATVIISDNTAGNYNITGTKDFTISKAPGEVTTKPTAKSLIYTGNSQKLVNAGSGTGTIYYRLGTSGSFSTEIPSATNAGTYTVYFYAAESNNYLQSTPTESVNNITIVEKSISIPTPTGYSAQYDGNAHTATFGSTTGASITKYRYSTNNSTWTESSSNPSLTNVGTLYTQAYYSANTDYTGSRWSSSATISIAARPINIYAGSDYKTYDGTALTYNSATAESTGTNRGLVSGHSMTSCTVTGSITNAGRVNNVPSAAVIKSGSTDVTSNYSISYVNGTLTVIARYVVYTANDESWTYDGNVHNASNTARITFGDIVSGHTATFSCSGSVGPNVGTATKTLSSVTIKSGSTDVSSNYDISKNNGTLSITRANTASASASNKTYNGTTESNGTSQTGVTGSNVSWSGTTSATNAGSYTAYATPDGNHAWSNTCGTELRTINWSIARRGQNPPTLNGSSVTYPSTASASVKTAGTIVGGTAICPGTLTWSNQSRSSVGSLTATAYYAATTTNFSASSSASATVTVNKFTPTVTLSATNRIYNGSALYATATVSGASGGATPKGTIYYGTSSGATTYSVTYSGSAVNLSSVSVTNYNNGSGNSVTVYAYFVPDSSCNGVYNNSGNASRTLTITGKANQSAPTATDLTTTYHNTATGSASGGGGVGSLYYKSDANGGSSYGSATTTAPTRTAVGTTKYVAYWGGNGNYNASPESAAKSLVINKATDQSITVTRTPRTYTGSGQVVASATAHGISNYYLGFGSSSTVQPSSWGSANSSISATTAGTYYIWYKGTVDGNHSADIGATYSGTVVISKKGTNAPVLTAGGTTTYTGTTYYAKAATGSGNPAGKIYYGSSSGATTYNITASTTAANLSSMGRADVGTTTIYAFFRPNDTTNYSDSSVASTTVTISNKAPGSVSGSGSTVEWTGSLLTVGSLTNYTGTPYVGFGVGTSSTDTPASWTQSNIFKATNAGTFYLWAKCDSSINYEAKGATYIGTATVVQRDLLITTSLTNLSHWGFINGTATLTLSGAKGSITSRSSSNTSVATIDSNNVITIKGKGTATITINVSSATGYKAATVTYTINLVYRHTYYNGINYYEFSDGHLWGMTNDSTTVYGHMVNTSSSVVRSLLNNQNVTRNYYDSNRSMIFVHDNVTGASLRLPTLISASYGHGSEKVAIMNCLDNMTLEVTNSNLVYTTATYYYSCGLVYLN